MNNRCYMHGLPSVIHLCLLSFPADSSGGGVQHNISLRLWMGGWMIAPPWRG